MLKNPVEILPLIPAYALSCNIFFYFLPFFGNRGIFSLKIGWERVQNATRLFSCENCGFWWADILYQMHALVRGAGWLCLPMEEPRAASVSNPSTLPLGILLGSISRLAVAEGLGYFWMRVQILPWGNQAASASRVPVHPPRHPPCCIWVSVSSCLSFGAPTWGSWGYGDATALIINCCLSQQTPSGKWSAKA